MQIVAELQRVLATQFDALGKPMSEAQTFQIAVLQYEAMRDLSCRGQLYLRVIRKHMRNEAIRAKFNGSNLREVCDEFDVGKTTVYRVCGRPQKAGV